MSLESHFAPFRSNIIGIDQDFETPFGRQRILYADWTASGRMFGPRADDERADRPLHRQHPH